MMAANSGRRAANRPPTIPEPLQVPRTPLESRQGYHPKTDDRLLWKSPPSRQLSHQKRVEYESDVRERFYDDYLGNRATGDARNEVLTTTELAKLKFNPNHYRVNAYQGMAYDPMRPVPAGLDFNVALQQEKVKERQRHAHEHRQRRLSDSSIGSSSRGANSYYYQDQYTPAEPIQQQQYYTGLGATTTLPPLQLQRPRSALQQSMDEVVNPELAPAVENWMQKASKREQEVATDFFRTLSSHGQRPDPASKASLHKTRVRSAVMTPSRKERDNQKATQSTFQQLSRETAMMDKQSRPTRKSEPSRKHQLQQRSNSEKGNTKGAMTFTANKQLPSHFTVHSDWASEAISHS